MKTTDLLSCPPQEVKEHLLNNTPELRPHRDTDAILINFCDRIAALETLVDRLQEMLPSAK